MKKIGILGGTFNPIHTGHLIIAEQAYEEYKLDKVLIIPSGVSYLKKDMDILSGEIRLKMASYAIEGNPHFETSDIEIKREGNTYTADTIDELKILYPGDELYFITGADTFHDMGFWMYPERIFAGCTVLIALRNDENYEDLEADISDYSERYGAKTGFLHTPDIEISSSMIRENVSKKRSIRYYVPENVREFILENRLYE